MFRVEGPGRAPFWAILGLPEIMEIEKNSDVFTNAPTPTVHADPPAPDAAAEAPPINTLIQMDGDEHKAHRQLVNEWFKPGEVKKLRRPGRRAGHDARSTNGRARRRVRLRQRHRDAVPAATSSSRSSACPRATTRAC